jgi:hypothetical protein
MQEENPSAVYQLIDASFDRIQKVYLFCYPAIKAWEFLAGNPERIVDVAHDFILDELVRTRELLVTTTEKRKAFESQFSDLAPANAGEDKSLSQRRTLLKFFALEHAAAEDALAPFFKRVQRHCSLTWELRTWMRLETTSTQKRLAASFFSLAQAVQKEQSLVRTINTTSEAQNFLAGAKLSRLEKALAEQSTRVDKLEVACRSLLR